MEKFLKSLHLACVVDENRPNLALISIKNGIATASNGNLLVRMDLTRTTTFEKDMLEFMEGKNIHCETWKEIQSCDSLVFGEKQIDCLREGIKKTYYYAEATGELYDAEKVIIDVKKSGQAERGVVSMNAENLVKLKKIFDCDTLHFSFSKKNVGTVVYPSHDSGMFAILAHVETEGADMNRYIFMNK